MGPILKRVGSYRIANCQPRPMNLTEPIRHFPDNIVMTVCVQSYMMQKNQPICWDQFGSICNSVATVYARVFI